MSEVEHALQKQSRPPSRKVAQNFGFEQPANDLGLSIREICT
jgi:hypothetical protein